MDFQTIAKNYSLLKNVPYAKVKILKSCSADKIFTQKINHGVLNTKLSLVLDGSWKMFSTITPDTKIQTLKKKKRRNFKRKSKRSKINIKEHMSSVLQTFIQCLMLTVICYNCYFCFPQFSALLTTWFCIIFFLTFFMNF